MSNDIVMRIRCEECGIKYSIKENELDDYNIYWTQGGKLLGFQPHLLCSKCTKFWTDKIKKGA